MNTQETHARPTRINEIASRISDQIYDLPRPLRKATPAKVDGFLSRAAIAIAGGIYSLKSKKSLNFTVKNRELSKYGFVMVIVTLVVYGLIGLIAGHERWAKAQDKKRLSSDPLTRAIIALLTNRREDIIGGRSRAGFGRASGFPFPFGVPQKNEESSRHFYTGDDDPRLRGASGKTTTSPAFPYFDIPHTQASHEFEEADTPEFDESVVGWPDEELLREQDGLGTQHKRD